MPTAMNEAEKLADSMDDEIAQAGRVSNHNGMLAAALLRGQAEQIKVLRRVLDLCLEVIDRADTAAGYCCCGESIDGHADAMICGHSAVDAGHYASSHIVAEARSALAATKEET